MKKYDASGTAGRLLRHYLSYATLIIIAGAVFYVYKGKRDTITFLAWSSGYISFVLLASSLVIGSLNLLSRRRNPLSTYFRRYLGITAGGLALFHSVTGLFVHLRGKPWLYFLVETDSGRAIRLDKFGLANYTGLIAAIIIFLLLATSNDKMIRMLGPGKWKNVQRLSYLMFILVLIHAYFYNGAEHLFLYVPVIIALTGMQIAGIVQHRKGLTLK